MARFLHTSDWQIGARPAWAGERAGALAEKRLEAAGRAVAAARSAGVEFVLLAGDTFEHHDIDDALVRRTVMLLNELAPLPVFVLPGNHDPLVAGGIWDRPSWAACGPHVTLCREPALLRVSDALELLPSPLYQKVSREDPTAWMAAPRRLSPAPGRLSPAPGRLSAAPGGWSAAPEDQTPSTERAGSAGGRAAYGDGVRPIRIGLAHGALDVFGARGNFPIAVDRPASAALDYLALGDWHGFKAVGRAVYSGTIEPTGFEEREAGQALVVEIAAPGAEPRITPVATRGLSWLSVDEIIEDETDVSRLERTIAAVGAAEALVLRVRLRVEHGLPEAALQALEALQERLVQRAFVCDWNLDTEVLTPAAPSALGDGLLAGVDDVLRRLASGAAWDASGPAELPPELMSADAETARAARALLHRLIRRSGA